VKYNYNSMVNNNNNNNKSDFFPGSKKKKMEQREEEGNLCFLFSSGASRAGSLKEVPTSQGSNEQQMSTGK